LKAASKRSIIFLEFVRASKHSPPNMRPCGYKSDARVKEPS
jgi:hypothetical protein